MADLVDHAADRRRILEDTRTVQLVQPEPDEVLALIVSAPERAADLRDRDGAARLPGVRRGAARLVLAGRLLRLLLAALLGLAGGLLRLWPRPGPRRLGASRRLCGPFGPPLFRFCGFFSRPFLCLF